MSSRPNGTEYERGLPADSPSTTEDDGSAGASDPLGRPRPPRRGSRSHRIVGAARRSPPPAPGRDQPARVARPRGPKTTGDSGGQDFNGASGPVFTRRRNAPASLSFSPCRTRQKLARNSAKIAHELPSHEHATTTAVTAFFGDRIPETLASIVEAAMSRHGMAAVIVRGRFARRRGRSAKARASNSPGEAAGAVLGAPSRSELEARALATETRNRRALPVRCVPHPEGRTSNDRRAVDRTRGRDHRAAARP